LKYLKNSFVVTQKIPAYNNKWHGEILIVIVPFTKDKNNKNNDKPTTRTVI